MNVLLICPRFPDTFWGFRHALKIMGKKAMFPPLGLLTISPMLPADWNQKLVDMNVADLTDADLAWADLAMITGMSVQRDAAQQVIARCKAADLTVVAGGPMFTLEAELFPEVDHLVLNEAEITLPIFLKDFAAGRAKRIYASEEKADMSVTPLPAWHLVDQRRYAMMSMQYSRGCPFTCEFCEVTTLFGHKPRVKTPEHVIAELNGIVGAGWLGPVFVVDDNLIGNPRQLKSTLLPAMIEWKKTNVSTTFNTQVSINLADDAVMTEMFVKAGFDSVFIGIETPDAVALKECRKGQNLKRDMVEDVKTLQRAGMEVQAGFIIGFDSDGPDIFQRQIDFIQASGIATAMVGILQAPAGTKLYERMAAENRLVGRSTGDNVDGSTNIIPAMGMAALMSGYQRVLREIYSPENYYGRLRRFIAECGPQLFNSPVGKDEIVGMLRSILKFGFLSKGRRAYWKMMAWTIWHRPDLFGIAVSLSISGYHLRRFCIESTAAHDWRMNAPGSNNFHGQGKQESVKLSLPVGQSMATG